ncbi:MAG: cytoskeleton protein RodZ [Thermoleophilaceae bacterium]|nr:cytoskeleton protein RodZ [Thermoleophilaceae bacterium]
MRQKIDIADIETATKIRAKYLRALENEEFGLLPGPTFVKTFLRTYADYLGLDAQLLVEEYRVQHEPRGEEFAPIRSPRAGTRDRGRDRRGPRRGPPSPGAIIAGVVVLLLIVIYVIGSVGSSDNGGGGGKTAKQTTPTSAAATAKKKRAARAKARKRRQRQAAAAARRTVKLTLVPVGQVYTCVADGSGKLKFGGNLPGRRTFTGKRLKITLGRTTVKVTVNKKPLKIPPSANPVGYDLRAGKAPVPLPAGQRPTC